MEADAGQGNQRPSERRQCLASVLQDKSEFARYSERGREVQKEERACKNPQEPA